MPKRTRLSPLVALFAAVAGLVVAVVSPTPPSAAAAGEECRPDGLYQTPGVAVPYCSTYDTEGRESLGDNHSRRVIGYFTSWRTGRDGAPAYLASDIPWTKVTHLNYAFAHIDAQNRVSVGPDGPDNPSTGMTWPGVEPDPSLPYKGHFNLLNKYKKQHPNVKTMISVGGWAETGGFFNADGTRNASGGFYKLGAQPQATVDAFADSAVDFIRKYGFNGVDIDYEYATSNNHAGNPDDFWIANANRGTLWAGYEKIMKTLREKLDRASAQDGRHYLLTAAVPASGWLLRGQEAYQVTRYVDYLNVMSYDLHGSWNHFVGPNAALYDDGKDGELAAGGVYTAPQYEGMGYLNTDWAYHYYRGAMQAGRINLGVPFYSRGWQGVTGGTNGLWGRAALPDQTKCPPGTGSSVGSTTPCGNGAVGIDNLWHDSTAGGAEVPSGVNPMWHAKNLENEITPDYLAQHGLDPANDPTDRISGSYNRFYDSTLTSPWLWNADKKVFLSTEDEQSIAAKAKYVADKGIGGIMIWELAGDYRFDSAKGQYTVGDTLLTKINEGLRGAAPYGARKASGTTPSQVLNVSATVSGFALGDSNYPITPKLKLTNNSTTTLPGGTKIEFDYGTSAPGSMADQSGFGLRVTAKGHSGSNVGGLKGDFQHVELTLPTWQSLAPGASVDVALSYQLPIASPSNVKLTFGGQSYAIASDHPRGGGDTGTTTSTTTTTTTTTTTDQPSCTVPAWDRAKVYNGGNEVSHRGKRWQAKWWTQGEEPGTTGEWGVWRDLGAC
ncbi:chitinase C-terminal domain-containing protein [Saccharothrix sp. NRRL B-16348]|uniref:chitinase C-terminal domain-containing protein n=1 Tax=Saccharothrix sp. NRRL B-16348 TaxID=1415542 RepID=UPI0006B01388|nr:glycosyl hydrolase family 18 protein [Saccharothrix sp. NRRL B-16348]